MTKDDITALYRGYIACLNTQDWAHLGSFVHEDAHYNGTPIGLSGYRKMLESDFSAIPDLRFTIDFLVADPPRIASRLLFDCAPIGELLGLSVNGRKVSFTENVFYEFEDARIRNVWSIIDKAAIAAQL